MSDIEEDGRTLGIHYDQEGRVVELDFQGKPMYRISYTGEVVEVKTPTENYVVTLRGTFFSAQPAQNKIVKPIVNSLNSHQRHT